MSGDATPKPHPYPTQSIINKCSGGITERVPWTGPHHQIRDFVLLFLLPCPWPALPVIQVFHSYASFSKRPSLTVWNRLPSIQIFLCLITCFIFIIALTAVWNYLIWLTLLSVSLSGMWITGGQGPCLNPQCLEQYLVYSMCSINIWMKLYLFWLLTDPHEEY